MTNDNLQPMIYSFKLPDANKNIIDFTKFRNKVIVIVNVATFCGFTPQYKELQYLYDKYNDQGLEIIGFPCNQFGNQEPFNDEQIVEYCHKKFGVTFPIMKKIKVNGELKDPEVSDLYRYLKNVQHGPLGFKGIRWNFEKFIVNKNGEVVARFTSMINPLQFEDYIKQLLNS